MSDSPVVQLIDPNSSSDGNEKQGELDGDREQQHSRIHSVDRAGSTDAFERLPTEGLESHVRRDLRNASGQYSTHLEQPPR